MAKKQPEPVAEPVLEKVPHPPTPQWIVGKCDDTGVRVVHLAQKFYREVEGQIEECGTTGDGQPDANWAKVSDVPQKALSMLGKL